MSGMRDFIIIVLDLLILLLLINIVIICVINADLIWPQKSLDLRFLIEIIFWKIVLLFLYILIIDIVFLNGKLFESIGIITITLLGVIFIIGLFQILAFINDIQAFY